MVDFVHGVGFEPDGEVSYVIHSSGTDAASLHNKPIFRRPEDQDLLATNPNLLVAASLVEVVLDLAESRRSHLS